MAAKFTALSDESWEVIEKLAQIQLPLQRGKPRTDLRKIWNSIFYILISGVRWEDLPTSEYYATRPTAHRWLVRWQKEGVFDRVLSGLLQDAVKAGKIDLSQLSVDGTFSLRTRGRATGGIWAQRKGRAHSPFSGSSRSPHSSF